MYRDENHKDMTLTNFERLLSNTLYYKRFFPYYNHNVLAGIDEDGKGVCFTYDSVGSGEAIQYGATGSGHQLLMSILDAQLKNRRGWARQGNALLAEPVDFNIPGAVPLDAEEAMALIKDAMTSAAERDIHTGDTLEIVLMRKDMPVHYETFQLRRD